jgi:hypothetical protein
MTRKTIQRPVIASALVALLGLPALAVEIDPAVDVNADAMYSYPELQVVYPDMTEDQFTVMDTNGDGLLDVDEVTAATESGMMPASDG